MMDILVNADVFQKTVLGILLISLFWALFCSWSKGIESAIKVLGASCLLSIFLLALSQNSADLRNDGSGILFILKSILFSLHSIKFEIKEHDLPESDSADATGMFFSTLLVLLVIFVPFFLFGYIASVVEPIKKYLKFRCMKHGKNLFFFAGLDEKTLCLAKDIISKDKKAWIIFTSCKLSDLNKAFSQKQMQRCFAFNGTVEEYAKARKNTSYYFIAGDKELQNVDDALSLVKKLSKLTECQKARIQIFVFAKSDTAKQIFNKKNKCGISLSIVNEYELTALNLLLKKPLYYAPEKQGKQTVLLIGLANSGMNILKNLIWANCGNSVEQVQIISIDSDATLKMNCLKRDCPELFCGEYDLVFKDVDPRTSSLSDFLNSLGERINYVTVSTENDKENLEIGNFLHRYFMRNYSDPQKYPYLTILARQRLSEKTSTLIYGNEKSGEFAIRPFGMLEDIYSYDLIVNSEIEKLAMNVHAAYSNFDEMHPSHPKESLATYMEDENNRYSSRVAAVHIFYKLHALGFSAHVKKQDEIQDPSVVDAWERKIKDNTVLKHLTQLEHDRWNAYMRIAGWIRLPLEKTTKKQRKNMATLEHACICSWEELKKVDEFFGSDFCAYDRKMILCIPAILGISENKNINISGVKYILERSKER